MQLNRYKKKMNDSLANCKDCGKEFTVTSPNQQYCPEHHWTTRRLQPKRPNKCKHCGCTYTVKGQGGPKRGDTRHSQEGGFCYEPECTKAYQRARQKVWDDKKKGILGKSKQVVIKICKGCKEEFKVKGYLDAKNNLLGNPARREWCSEECRKKHFQIEFQKDRERCNGYKKRAVDNLSDHYVKSTIAKNWKKNFGSKISIEEIPQWRIENQRTLMEAKRAFSQVSGKKFTPYI
jgi:hypothetical protein